MLDEIWKGWTLQIFYRTSVEENVPFKVLDLLGKEDAQKHFSEIALFVT